jgi:hypothetical protein
MRRGLYVAALHLALVLSMTAKYAWDRAHLPRAWARTVNYDPNLPVRGRYVNLMIVLDPPQRFGSRVKLSAQGGLLKAEEAAHDGLPATRGQSLLGPVAFFIPEHAKDPTRVEPGEELWVEVSVPPEGMPRPLRLGVKKNGVISPMEFR